MITIDPAKNRRLVSPGLCSDMAQIPGFPVHKARLRRLCVWFQGAASLHRFKSACLRERLWPAGAQSAYEEKTLILLVTHGQNPQQDPQAQIPQAQIRHDKERQNQDPQGHNGSRGPDAGPGFPQPPDG
jgi:hypothetical protein